MTLPVTGGAVRNSFETYWAAAGLLRSDCILIQNRTTGGAATSLDTVLAAGIDAMNFVAMHDALVGNSSLSAAVVTYAQSQAPGTSFTGTDFVAARDAANSVFTAIAAAYPVDGTGHLLDRKFSGSGVVWSTATAAQMPTIMTAITAFLATVS